MGMKNVCNTKTKAAYDFPLMDDDNTPPFMRLEGMGARRRKSMSTDESRGSPAQRRTKLTRLSRCRDREFTTVAPDGTCGALSQYERREQTVLSSPELASASETRRTSILWKSSQQRTRSSITGTARSESSHVLWRTRQFVPPRKMRE